MRIQTGLATLALALLFAAAPQGVAQAQTVATIHMDFDAWNQGFPSSRISALWNDSAIVNWRNTTLQVILDSVRDDTGFDPRALQGRLVGNALVLVTLIPSSNQYTPPEMEAAIAFHQPGQIDALIAALEASAQTEEALTSLQETMLRQGDVLVLGTGDVIRQEAARSITAGMGGLPPDPGAFISGHLDFNPLMSQFRQTAPRDAAHLNGLGFGNASALDFSGRFEGSGMMGETSLTFNGERRGLFDLVGSDGPFTVFNMMPPEAMTAVGLHIPPPETLIDWFGDLLVAMDGPAEREGFLQALEDFRLRTGMDLRSQVMPAIGQEIGLVFSGMTGVSGDGALIATVRDAETVQQFINTLISLANQSAPPDSGFQLSPMPMTQGEITYQMLIIPGMPIALCYGIIDNHLVLASSANQMNAICQAAQTGVSLASSQAFQQTTARVNTHAAVLSYGDSRRAFETWGQTVMPMIMMQGASMPPEMFQTLSLWPVVARHMGRNATSVSAHPTGFDVRMHSDSGVEVLATTGVGPVLAAVAVPNFLEAQVRSRVSRTRADMRSMAVAIESYFIDWNAYPASTIGSAPDSASSASPLLDPMPTFSVNHSLSTPIAYITSHFPDVFIDQDDGLSTFSYFSDRRGWIVVSPGPDRDFDFNPINVYTSDVPQPSPQLLQYAFDPTNGTVSNGDIFRVRQ